MSTCESKLFGRLHIERLAGGGIYYLHLLTKVVVEIVVGLVATFLLLAAEHVDVVATLIGCLDNGWGAAARLVSPAR